MPTVQELKERVRDLKRSHNYGLFNEALDELAKRARRAALLEELLEQLANKYEATATDPNEGMSDEDYALTQARAALRGETTDG